MRYGVCAKTLDAATVKAAGFNYIEGNVTSICELSEEQLAADRAALAEAGIPMESCCCLFPGSIKVVGPTVNYVEIGAYLDKAFTRMSGYGVKTVVFGSGGSRRVPDGFCMAEARAQLVRVGRLLADYGRASGITVVLEPLWRRATNTINTHVDGLALVDEVDRPEFRLLVDTYHLNDANEGSAVIASVGRALCHAHWNNPNGGAAPRESDEYDYADFFKGLKLAGYNGRLSLECNFTDMPSELAEAKRLIKKYTGDIL